MLYLKKIEMYGFKSFADKVELRFDQPVTGIVGPNGCGKSNISDAVRWVLGEQSTKTLRGKNMQDLIFNGTDARKSMSYCEVSLFFDNTTRLFPIQLDEVIISRKLYRNNESEYSVNRNIVRLRDIQDMIRGVGLGREGYSIVGQGRMDAVLNAKPEDRRAIFEEAMGISRFRVKKVETERKLEKTHINMNQLNLISGELQRQIEPLRRQSANARKYLSYYEELKFNEINAYIYSYDNVSVEKEKCRKLIAGFGEELQQREVERAQANASYDELFHSKDHLDAEIASLRDRRTNLAVELERRSGTKNVIAERIAGCRKDIEGNEQRNTQDLQEIETLSKAIADGEETLEHDKQLCEKLEGEISSAQEKFISIKGRYDKLGEAQSEVEQRLAKAQSNLAEISEVRARCEAQNSTVAEQLASIDANEREIAERISALSGTESNLLKRYDELKNNRDELAKQAEDIKQQVKQLEHQQFQNESILVDKQRAYAGEKGSIDLLKDFADNYKGYQTSVQNLMKDAQYDEALSSRICGVVANLVKVKPQLQTAIESALGGRLQNVVTENEEDTKYLINHLKQNAYGRITFLPVSSMKPHGIVRREILDEKGVLGIANDLVSYDMHYASVYQSLLGGIIVVDTYDNAVALSRKYRYSHRMVTLAGEKISDDGSIEGGGARRQGDGLLSYETQIAERTAKLEQLKAELEQAQATKANCDGMLQSLRAKQSQTAQQLNDVAVALTEAEGKIQSSNALSNSDKNSILSLTTDKQRLQATLESNNKTIDECHQNVEKYEKLIGELKQKLQTVRNTADSENTAIDSQREALSGVRVRYATLQNRIEGKEREIESNKARIALIQDGVDSRLHYIEQVNNAIETLCLQLNDSALDDATQNELSKLNKQIEEVDKLKSEVDDKFQKASDERVRLANVCQELSGKIENQNTVLENIDRNLQELQQRVLEEYDTTYSQAMQFKADDFDLAQAKVRISELKQAISRLGPVNVNAITDLEEVEARYSDISTQLEDINNSEEDLKNVLKELTTEIESRFEEGMQAINENFKVVFKELFNGGNARLYIEPDETKAPLDYGVEIEAQPPGKKLQNISLLSGGERSLTSCAILFAILKYQPMPFCVLDEVEAPLDDSNADRIARFIRKFSEMTQFVVITHKKPTMEHADVLYGVTMEEKGVSKIVSVKLTDAVKEAM